MRDQKLREKLQILKSDLKEGRKRAHHKTLPDAMPIILELSDEEHSMDDSATKSAGDSDSSAESSENVEGREPPGALEAFSGKGVLTRELGKAGFSALAIDHKNCKDTPVARTVWLDLATKEGQMEFWSFVRSGKVQYVHFAPPCGTASRAREVRRKGCDPKPLRSTEHPDGLPGLKGDDLVRVVVANELYKFTARAAMKLDGLGIAWSIENPANSHLWETKHFKELLEASSNAAEPFHCDRVDFDMCMHGGKRPKKTSFLFGGGIDLSPLAVQCDGSHEHLPWGMTRDGSGTFATAGERNYPDLLCRRVARRAALACKATPVQKYSEAIDRAEHLEDQPGARKMSRFRNTGRP